MLLAHFIKNDCANGYTVCPCIMKRSYHILYKRNFNLWIEYKRHIKTFHGFNNYYDYKQTYKNKNSSLKSMQ